MYGREREASTGFGELIENLYAERTHGWTVELFTHR